MINNNKILTVSYGTFSCTLEGFDDSFGTMKAIAEYFRDLSADDRYFGAEPAQPDAQMLARIAQREISRHVEAREDRGRIVLSAQDTQQAEAIPTPEADNVEVQTPATQAPIAEAVDVAPEQTAPEVQVAEAAQETPVSDEAPVVLEVSEKADSVSETEVEASPVALEEVAVEETAPELANEVAADNPDIVPSLPDADVEAFFAETTATSQDSEDFVEEAIEDVVTRAEVTDEGEVTAQDRAKADSIAEKLKRIRAVVSQQSDAPDAPDYSEDQHADATAAKISAEVVFEDVETDANQNNAESDVLADTLRDLEDALDADDATFAEDETTAHEENEEDDIAAILNRLEAAEESDTSIATEELTEIEIDDDFDDNILAAMDSIVAAPDADDLDDLGDDHLFGETAKADEEEDTKATAPIRTRVLKVKRATLEAAIKAGQLEEYDDEEEDEAPVARNQPRSSLSDAEEEELARDLAELEADMDAGDVEIAEPTPVESIDDVTAENVVEDRSSLRADIHGDAENDLSRLMDETDSQMDEPESATRRDAFTHLRAAVAAKKADEAVGGDLGENDSDEAYRDDLANVVRPRRPVSGGHGRTERPADQRPAPLKLVAEQRIDVDSAVSATPVRPRRVATAVQPPKTVDGVEAASFTDFAADVGADTLPDLLEAAAAYLSFVEGHEQFSRPQLMTKVRQVEKENFTREESLRSFGKLLREGKIEKLKGGRFQASDQIGFKQDARAAG